MNQNHVMNLLALTQKKKNTDQGHIRQDRENMTYQGQPGTDQG